MNFVLPSLIIGIFFIVFGAATLKNSRQGGSLTFIGWGIGLIAFAAVFAMKVHL